VGPKFGTSASKSVIVFAVNVAAIWQFARWVRPGVPSWARTTVRTSPVTSVTRIISALLDNGWTPAGHTVTLNGATGNTAPVPVATVSSVPVVAGTGTVATVVIAKFA